MNQSPNFGSKNKNFNSRDKKGSKPFNTDDKRSRRGGTPGGTPDRDQVEVLDEAGIAIVRDPNSPEIFEKVVEIKRITKVTKGGKRLMFSALVVVGDAMGKVGYSCEKAKEVSLAIRKALLKAKRKMIKINLNGFTIPHEIIGECGAAQVLLKPASEGTGVIASGSVRAVCDGAGIRNILTKCHRSSNPNNVIKATFDGLTRLKSATFNKN